MVAISQSSTPPSRVGLGRVEHHVVEAVVVVDDARRPSSGACRSASQATTAREARRRSRSAPPVALGPALHLAAHVARRPCRGVEARAARVDRVQLDQVVDDREAELRASLAGRGASPEQSPRGMTPVDALHDVEVAAEHRRVVAEGEHLGHAAGRRGPSAFWMRYSRPMSCADFALVPAGGRRSTSSCVAVLEPVRPVRVPRRSTAVTPRRALERPADPRSQPGVDRRRRRAPRRAAPGGAGPTRRPGPSPSRAAAGCAGGDRLDVHLVGAVVDARRALVRVPEGERRVVGHPQRRRAPGWRGRARAAACAPR